MGGLFLILFIAVTFAVYIAIRRNWLPTAILAGGGTVINIVLFVLFGLTQPIGTTQVFVLAIVLGAVFTLSAVMLALFFKNQATPDPLDAAPPTDSESQ